MVKDHDFKQILSTDISLISLSNLVNFIVSDKHYSVAVCNVNSLVAADKSSEFNKLLNSFDFRVADGMPLVWYLRLRKYKQERLNGAKIFHNVIKTGIDKNLTHYFLGSSDDVLTKMKKNLYKKYPQIIIDGTWAPPLADVKTITEQVRLKRGEIEKSDILWVGLGMPKQEELISMIEDFSISKIGVGAVFEWVAETKKQAPVVIQKIGFEGLFRLLTEPKRLWKRYFFDFIYLLQFPFNYRKKT